MSVNVYIIVYILYDGCDILIHSFSNKLRPLTIPLQISMIIDVIFLSFLKHQLQIALVSLFPQAFSGAVEATCSHQKSAICG